MKGMISPMPMVFQRAGHLTSLPPLSLYIHIPWCVRKCPYCDFNSHAVRGSVDEERYIDALIADLEQDLPLIWGRSIRSIFLGGGTPSLFSPAALDRLLMAVRARIPIVPDAEITLEANPGTFEQERFQAYAQQVGINRMSVGVQSFSAEHLQRLGRIHSGDEAKRAIETALSCFPRVNVDLMHALPHQTVAQAEEDVATALALGVGHLSAYQLTLEPHTEFAAHPPAGLPDDDQAADIQEAVHAMLSQHGLQRYEVSAFAKTLNDRARHNLNYWQFGDYLGIGAGAHSKISNGQRIHRMMKHKQPQAYLAAEGGSCVQKSHWVEAGELPFEFMMNALRLIDGVPRALWAERTGLSYATIAPIVQDAQQRGWLQSREGMLVPTAQGINFLNDLLALFMAPQALGAAQTLQD